MIKALFRFFVYPSPQSAFFPPGKALLYHKDVEIPGKVEHNFKRAVILREDVPHLTHSKHAERGKMAIRAKWRRISVGFKVSMMTSPFAFDCRRRPAAGRQAFLGVVMVGRCT